MDDELVVYVVWSEEPLVTTEIPSVALTELFDRKEFVCVDKVILCVLLKMILALFMTLWVKVDW